MGLTLSAPKKRFFVKSKQAGDEYYWIEGKITWNNNKWVPQGTVVWCCIRCSLDGGQTWEEATTFGTVDDATGDFACNPIVLPSTALTGVAYCYGVAGGIVQPDYGQIPNTAPGTTILDLITAIPAQPGPDG